MTRPERPFAAWQPQRSGAGPHGHRDSLEEARQVYSSWSRPEPGQKLAAAQVSCDFQGSVIDITLEDAGLAGTLAPELANLPMLRSLNLIDNEIQGDLKKQRLERGSGQNIITQIQGNNI